jgi:hypothetical protein
LERRHRLATDVVQIRELRTARNSRFADVVESWESRLSFERTFGRSACCLAVVSRDMGSRAPARPCRREFTEEEQLKLTLMVNIINGWNRIAVGFGLFADPAEAKAVVEAAAA